MALLWKIALSLLATICILYLGAIAWLWWNQRSLIYPAPPYNPHSLIIADAGSDVVWLRTNDGLTLRAIYRPARSGRPTIIFFHGNGDSLAGSQQATRVLAAQGYGLLLPEYRGYGGNPGSPSEQGLYRDGNAALAWLAQRGIAPSRTAVIGNSLGSGIATEMATRSPIGALVLVSAFTSMPDAVHGQIPLVPAKLLVSERYENRRKIRRVKCPILILHGDNDTLVPVRHGMTLARERPDISLEVIAGTGHELVYTDKSQVRIAAWLRHVFRQPTIGT